MVLPTIIIATLAMARVSSQATISSTSTACMTQQMSATLAAAATLEGFVLSPREKIAVLSIRLEECVQRIDNVRVAKADCKQAADAALEEWQKLYARAYSSGEQDPATAYYNARKAIAWTTRLSIVDEYILLQDQGTKLEEDKAITEEWIEALKGLPTCTWTWRYTGP